MLLLDQAPNIDLLGVTVVAGNTPMPSGVATGARQLEAIGSDVADLRGQPPRHPELARPNPEALEAEEVVSPIVGLGGYLSAADSDAIDATHGRVGGRVPVPLRRGALVSVRLRARATRTRTATRRPIEFLVNTVNENPGEVTLVVIGPVTNIARAIMAGPHVPVEGQADRLHGRLLLPARQLVGQRRVQLVGGPGRRQDRRPPAVGRSSSPSPISCMATRSSPAWRPITTPAACRRTSTRRWSRTRSRACRSCSERESRRSKAGAADFGPRTSGTSSLRRTVIDPSIVLSWNDDPRPGGRRPAAHLRRLRRRRFERWASNYGQSTAFSADDGTGGSPEGCHRELHR